MSNRDVPINRIRIAYSVPKLRQRRIPFWHTPAGDTSEMCCLEREITCVFTHYNKEDKRSEFCTKHEEGAECEYCTLGIEPTWQGYMLVELKSHAKDLRVMHFTVGCVNHRPELVDTERSLIGTQLRVSRQGATVRQPQICVSLIREFYTPRVRPHFDMLQHLSEIYARPNNDKRRGERK